MIDSYFRSPYQKLMVDPVIKVIQRFSIKPDHLTIAALLMGLASGIGIIFDFPFLAAGLLIISGFLDTLDGSLARAIKQTSPKGAVWDIVGDRIVEFWIVFCLFLAAQESRALVSMAMLGSILLCITTFLIVGIFTENQSEKSFYYSPGIMERTEAFIFFALMILFPDYFQILGLLFAALVFLTAGVRVTQFSKQS